MTMLGQNFDMFAGDDKIVVVQVVDPADNPVDISGCTFRWVWYKRSPVNIVLDKTTTGSGGIELTDPLNGFLEITLVPADTETLLGSHNHELELTDINSKISTVMIGYVNVLASRA